MGRNKGPGVRIVSLRLAEPTANQLDMEAKAQKKPLGTYLRELLEAYAPGIAATDIGSMAKKLSATSFMIDK